MVEIVVVCMLLFCMMTNSVVSGSSLNASDISRRCSASQVPRPRVNIEDKSWVEYYKTVYSGSENVEPKDGFNVLYRYGPVATMAMDWDHKRPLKELPKDWGDTFYHRAELYTPSYQWAEVTRYSTSYLKTFRKSQKEDWSEGLSVGFPGRSRYNQTKVPYGCWFNLAKGSGIYVNVGRTFITKDKHKSDFFDVLGLTSKGCWKSSPEPFDCKDSYICSAVQALGYDSFQAIAQSELVICSGKCATEPIYGTCPPVDLKSGFNASKPCDCSEDKHLLNCGEKSVVAVVAKEHFIDMERIKQVNSSLTYRPFTCVTGNAKGPREKTGASRNFEVTIAFSSGILQNFNTQLPHIALALAAHTPIDTTLVVDVGDTLNSSSGLHRRRRLSEGKEFNVNRRVAMGGVEEGDKYDRNLGDARLPLIQRPPAHDSPPLDMNYDHSHHHDHDHHHHHHDSGKREMGMDPTVSFKYEDKQTHEIVWNRLQKVGYQAFGLDIGKAVTVDTSGKAPILSLNAAGFERMMLVTVGSARIGILALTSSIVEKDSWKFNFEYPPNWHMIRKITDYATCLKEAGADNVILMTGGELRFKEKLANDIFPYVDIVLGTGSDDVTCEGTWHKPNGAIVVQISREILLGIIEIHSNSDTGVSIKSRAIKR